jgi:hypothetical protein
VLNFLTVVVCDVSVTVFCHFVLSLRSVMPPWSSFVTFLSLRSVTATGHTTLVVVCDVFVLSLRSVTATGHTTLVVVCDVFVLSLRSVTTTVQTPCQNVSFWFLVFCLYFWFSGFLVFCLVFCLYFWFSVSISGFGGFLDRSGKYQRRNIWAPCWKILERAGESQIFLSQLAQSPSRANIETIIHLRGSRRILYIQIA